MCENDTEKSREQGYVPLEHQPLPPVEVETRKVPNGIFHTARSTVLNTDLSDLSDEGRDPVAERA